MLSLNWVRYFPREPIENIRAAVEPLPAGHCASSGHPIKGQALDRARPSEDAPAGGSGSSLARGSLFRSNRAGYVGPSKVIYVRPVNHCSRRKAGQADLIQHRRDQAEARSLVRKDRHDAGPAADPAVQPLDSVGGAQQFPQGGGEGKDS